MQRILEFLQRARERVNAKIAILVIVGLIGGIAVWQGFSHMAAHAPAGPKKQVATGVGAQGLLDSGSVRQAGAEVADGQMPGTGGVASAGGAYGESETTSPQLNPYAGGSIYQSETALPDNPYRASIGDEAGGAQPSSKPPTSPYAAAGQSDGHAAEVPGAAASTTASEAPATAAPVVDPVEAYAQRFKNQASAAKQQASAAKQHEPAEPRTLSPPHAAGPAADLTGNPYSQPATSPYAASASPTEPAPTVVTPSEMPPTRATLGALGTPYSSATGHLGASSTHSSPAADAPATGHASATPGERQLEGPQQPAITIEKFSPAEIQVGKPATFELVVRNVGHVPAQHVVVTDHVPAGTQLADVKPQPAQNADGSLVWQLGTMQPGDEVGISLQVMPTAEGEIGSTAHVTFAAQATSRSICTRPQLTVEHTAPPKVLIGESLTVGITVANPGTGPATGVMIEEDVPDGLAHVAGRQLEYEVGTLRPGESKRLELALKADKAGLIENTIVVRGDGNLSASHRVQVEVIAPQLEVDVSGPKKRFLQRQATYTVSVANPGTAPARDVELVAYLPRGMKFVESDSQGQYDSAQHAVFWSLEELPVSKAGSVKLTTLPVEPGEQRLRIEGKADLGLAVAGEQIVQVEQSAELLHSVKDADDVIEVGSETAYLIKVSNVGTKAATNVRVTALLPPGIKGTAGEGPTRASGDATQVIFEPLAKLEPKEEVTFKVLAQGVAPGDHIVRVQLSSDEWPTPVTREESTRVYEDR